MLTAFKRLKIELGKHSNEYVLFVISLIIPAIICLLAFNVFLEIIESLEANELVSFDNTITEFIHSFRNDKITPVVTFITDLGDVAAYMVIIPLIAILLYYHGHHRWKLSLQATIVLLSAFFLNIALKNLISRPRPLEELRLVTAHSYSFPSGHSMSAFAFYGFLIYLTYKHVSNTLLKILLILIQLLLILSIGLSRVYLGVHFPTDVLAGFIAGLIWLIICIVVFNFINLYRIRQIPKKGSKPHSDH
ncbi:phosphatase PAP2 family protein [Fulvivirga sp. 29W222]|uniref:Phosphatase PAP2 family protein n=1 Tax=Fulvivirga marina TaxID=2494733 RepID=A0A937KDH4_9BACT|nr:phosphatase PAP2 family protein [Fulvivirga marina]MBL6446238.1 phosphatase PAP2 family protein [Fulvivirga marina]